MITLKTGDTSAVVDSFGAWVERLDTGQGPVFFPKQALTNSAGQAKTRGGMHVCLPNFGPGGDSGLDQHGFGRTLEWQVLEQSGTNVSLRLRGPGGYKKLESTLFYTLADSSLEAKLIVTNTGEDSLRVAPGFHPYFQLDDSETAVLVNNKTYQLNSLAGTEFVSADRTVLKTAKREITLSQKNLPSWAIWTDEMAKYVCVEPTAGGYRFLEEPKPSEFVDPGEGKVFICTISWS